MNTGKSLWPVYGLLSATLLLTGCFNEPQDESVSASEGRIKVAHLLPPRSGLTPLSDDAFKLSRWSTAETLVVLNSASDAQPALATSWEQINDTTWRFELRPNVKFHDNTDLTAQSVVNALSVAASAKPKPRILDGITLTAKVDGDNAVLITTEKRDPLLPQRLSSPQLAILSLNAYKENGVVNPVNAGTGPFILRSVNGTSSAALDRFDGYWGEKAKASGIDASFVPDGAAPHYVLARRISLRQFLCLRPRFWINHWFMKSRCREPIRFISIRRRA